MGPKRPKTVTYTGCWTCRSRKIKCDERRQPGGCHNCERSRLECAGYGVNLTWLSMPGRSDSHRITSGRRAVSSGPSCPPIISPQKLRGVLSQLDEAENQLADGIPQSSCIGPFSVFSVRPDSTASLASPASSTRQGTSRSPVDMEEKSTQGFIGQLETSKSVSMMSGMDGSLTSDAPTPSISTFVDPCIDPQLGFILTEGPWQPHDPSSILEASFPVVEDTGLKMLMCRYINSVADLLQPVLHHQNPWKTAYVPTALEAYEGLAIATNMEDTSPAAICLFNAVVFAVAYHLSSLNQDQSRLGNVAAVYHGVKAPQYFLTALDDPLDDVQYQTYMIAILSLVTADMLAGDSQYQIHLDEGNRLRAARFYDTDLDPSMQQLNEMCAFLSMIAQTTDWRHPPQPWTDVLLFQDPHIFEGAKYNFELIYGITKATTTAIFETCQLAQHLRYYEGQEHEIPPSLLNACQLLEQKLRSWNVEQETFASIDPRQPLMKTIIRSHLQAFHSAAMIYFYRSIRKCQPRDIKEHIESVAFHLHLVEDLKEALSLNTLMGPISWPAFIASTEAIDRAPWDRYWDRLVGRYRVGNFKKQWDIVHMVWMHRDQRGYIVPWGEVLRSSSIDVLAI